ncbi:MAG: hypothetical protein MZW92_64785 [Comamonadaceae bacterium]|nr:hypothetical protein [Comamonadaceae bacterium]
MPELGGKAVEGLYGVCRQRRFPMPKARIRELAAWIADYRRRFGAEPNVWSVHGLRGGGPVRARRSQRAGARLDADTLRRARFENACATRRDCFGSPELRVSRDRSPRHARAPHRAASATDAG